jgi:molybdenum cofactor guanylyltransferase
LTVEQDDLEVFPGFVLAGGASRRMGADKALLQLQGVTLIERAIRLLRAAGYAARIVGSRDDLEEYATVVADLRSGCGPLSGMEAGLTSLTTTTTTATGETGYALFIPVDMPMLPSALLRRMKERVAITRALVTVPRFQGREQPLCAIYHASLLPAVSLALDQGDYKVMRVITQAADALGGGIDIFDVESILAASGDYVGWRAAGHVAFLNCNTAEDFRLADFPMLGQPVH